MIDQNKKIEMVVCIGNGSLECDTITKSIASSLQMTYHMVLEPDTACKPGVYHTSIYDIKLSQLKQKLQNQNVKIILLNIAPSSYFTPQDYAYTRSMFSELAKIFPSELLIPGFGP